MSKPVTEIHVPAHRPWSVTLLAYGVLSIAIINLIGFYQVFLSWEILQSLLPFSPAWLGALHLFWGLSGLFIVLGLWNGVPWIPNLTRVACLAFAIYYWIDRIVLNKTLDREVNTLFMVLITIFVIMYTFIVMKSKTAQYYFRRRA
jgi:hypothetical protein